MSARDGCCRNLTARARLAIFAEEMASLPRVVSSKGEQK